MLGKYGADPLTHFAIAPHAPYTVSDAHLVEAWKLAEELNVRARPLPRRKSIA